MILPKYRKAVLIRFKSTRQSKMSKDHAITMQSIFVERKCYRVKSGDDWRWQIKGISALDHEAEIDQASLDYYGSKLKFEYVLAFL